MKIALINWSDRHVGGAETYIAQMLEALDAAGHQLAFWAEGHTPQERPAIAVPSRVEPLAGGWADGQRDLTALRAWSPDVLFVHGLVDPDCEQALQDVAPAVFFAHNYYGTCITGSKTHTAPAVAPCSRRFGPACLAQFYPRRCGGLNPLTMWTEYGRQSARRAHLPRYAAVLTFSEHMRREYLSHGVAVDRLHRVPPVVAPPRDHAAEVRTGRPPHRLVFAGRLDPLKGCRVLIDALPGAQAAIGAALELVVAGTGPDDAACREAARRVTRGRTDLAVDFRGWLPRGNTGALLRSADLVVMPSLWPEPLGLTGLEALVRGVPVTAFAVGGIPEWLEDGITGTLASGAAPTPAGLAAAIARALLDPGLARHVRENAAGYAAQWSLDRHLEQVLAVFDGVVARPLGARFVS
ncbi:MAG: glycosyltransferase family 4 protein [Vicinamibacterales bacterium]